MGGISGWVAAGTMAPGEAQWSARMGDPAAYASSLEGSFAVAVLDRSAGRLVLARDRLGEKPLYYAATGAGVAYATEMKALRALAADRVPGPLSVSPQALDAYLTFTYIPAPWTIFEQVRKVPAGHAVVFDLKAPEAAETIRYWSLPHRSGEEAAPARMLEMLREALRRRLPSTGPVGCFLSGGLDSSVVAALMAREGLAGFPAFSIGFEEAELDESAHARRVAALVGAEHHLIRLRDVEPEMVTAVIEQLGEPMADAATIPSYVLAREAALAARVVMTGDGADALLAGDHWFRRLRRLDALERLPRAIRPAVGLLGARMRALLPLLELPPAARYLRIRQKWTHAERQTIYSEDFRRRVDQAATDATYLGAPVEWTPGESVGAAVRLDSIHGLPEDLLTKADRMGMAHGVESRSPFLDQAFVEWAARLDINLLLRGATSKYLLKEAAESLLPRDLIHRRKQGFQIPVARWLKGPLRPLTEAAFDPALAKRQGIFDPGALALLKARFERGAPPSPALTGQVWQVVAFQTWWGGVYPSA
jgi:asparagine synthase (glutamine-hydrolysing)